LKYIRAIESWLFTMAYMLAKLGSPRARPRYFKVPKVNLVIDKSMCHSKNTNLHTGKYPSKDCQAVRLLLTQTETVLQLSHRVNFGQSYAPILTPHRWVPMR
jgi:hypothetical protein